MTIKGLIREMAEELTPTNVDVVIQEIGEEVTPVTIEETLVTAEEQVRVRLEELIL